MCEMEGRYGGLRIRAGEHSRPIVLRPFAELKAAKCEKIFQEKISGAPSDRKQLTRLMAARRLAVIMHRIWVDGTEFRRTREVAAA
jgi:hypothetical protein